LTKPEGAVEKKILEAAKTLFAQKGHEETRFQEIATRAGTSESQVTKYFGSKAGLLDALFSKARAYIDEPLKALREETEDPFLILERVSTLLSDFFQKDPELLAIYLFSRRFYTRVSPEQLLYGARFRELLASLFRKGREDKIFRDNFSPEAAASALWGAVQGMMRDKFYAERVSEFPDFSFEEMQTVSRAIIRAFAREKRK